MVTLSDRDPAVGFAALLGLSCFGDAAAVHPCLAWLRQNYERVRQDQPSPVEVMHFFLHRLDGVDADRLAFAHWLRAANLPLWDREWLRERAPHVRWPTAGLPRSEEVAQLFAGDPSAWWRDAVFGDEEWVPL